MTLLKGNELNPEKAKPIMLALRKKSYDDKFTDIVCGEIDDLKLYSDSLKDLLSEELLTKIQNEESEDYIT